MKTLLRFLFVIPIGFAVACFAAAFAMLWPFLRVPASAGADPVFLVRVGIIYFAQAAQIGSVTLIPWALFMVATETLGLSSILLHVAAGFLGGVALMFAAYGHDVPHMSVQTAIIVASLTFALVYWIVAGRSAGRWRRRRPKALRDAPLVAHEKQG